MKEFRQAVMLVTMVMLRLGYPWGRLAERHRHHHRQWDKSEL